ncbi:MAG: hypothetical protein AAGG01_01600 [Planctomycetota bacterium]
MISLLVMLGLFEASSDHPNTVRRFVERSETRTLKSVEASRDGRQLPVDRLPKLKRTDHRTLEIEVVDEWIEVDGLPRVQRTFDAAFGARKMEAQSLRRADSKPVEVTEEFDSVLVGEVLHAAHAKEGWTLAKTDGCSLGAETLKRLRADLSFGFLAASGEEEASKPRVLGAEAVAILMNPTGAIPKDDEEDWTDVSECRGGQVHYAGTVTVTPTKDTRYEGTPVQELAVVLKGRATWSSQPRPELGIEGESTLTGKGRALFDPKQKLVVLLELDVLAKTDQRENVSMELPDKSEASLQTVEHEERMIEVRVKAMVE